MSGERSLVKLMEFLDWLEAKGMMPTPTVAARKASVGKVLGILSEEEAQDVLALDVDSVMNRFNNLQGKNYTPDSLLTYRSRVRSTLEEFSDYIRNPLGYKPGVPSRERRPKVAAAARAASPSSQAASAAHSTIDVPLGTLNIFPIQLRPDLVVRIQGLPFDLTEAEARRISNVVMAMANPT